MSNIGKSALTATLFITACAPLNIYYKEGETVAQLEHAQTNCEVTALAQVPRDIRSRYIPPTYAPYQICNGPGHCYWQDRLLTPGRYEQYDANLPLRNKVADQCMSDQGYAKAKIKQCDAKTTAATELRATSVLPPLTANACAIRLKSGRWQIVTPDSG